MDGPLALGAVMSGAAPKFPHSGPSPFGAMPCPVHVELMFGGEVGLKLDRFMGSVSHLIIPVVEVEET